MIKRIWIMRKREDGVSPVIATILLVAVTVVLAAILYVMVLGFGVDTESIIVSFDQSVDANNWTLSVLTIKGTESLALVDVYLIATLENGTIGLAFTQVSTMASGTNYSGIVFNDILPTAYLNAGDYFTLDRSIYLANSQLHLTNGLDKTYVIHVL